MELKEGIAVAAGAVTEIGAFGEWTGRPGEVAAIDQHAFQIGRPERRT